MSELLSKHFDEPDETVSSPNMTGQIVVLGETYIGRYVYQPSWSWSKDVKPIVGTTSCSLHHQGVVLSGHLRMVTDAGAERTFGPGDAFDAPPGHDAFVIGNEPCITIEFRGARDFARPSAGGERVLTTLMVTDIVGSTVLATRLGDVEWKQLLARHSERVRSELERFRGYEITTTGDGFLAIFDGTARAVRCGASICDVAQLDEIEVRIGIHTGEIEQYTDNIRGVAVHVATRLAALAQPSHVLISDSTYALLEGSGLSFSDTGEHELKGLPGKRRLYQLVHSA